MMSILFVDSERVWRGGQHQLLTLLGGLARRGHEVHLACHPKTQLEGQARECGARVHPFSIRSEISPAVTGKLLGLMRRIRPDIVAFNTPRAILPGIIASRLAGVPVRLVFRRVNFPLRRTAVTRLKYRWHIDCIVAISESIRHQLVTDGVPFSRIRLIYEGIDLEPYPEARTRSAGRPGRPTVLGTVAHLSPEKGQIHLVEAAALIPDVCSRMRFIIVGDGACRQQLEDGVQTRGLQPCFQFTGFQTETSSYFQSFDIFVLPSLSEGLSSSILSAMASSLPVIATDVGGIPELVRSEVNGLLVPPADPAALARAMERLASDPAEAEEMGRRGRRLVAEHFTLEHKILETEALCQELLANRRSGRSRHERLG